jgi:hypothetical protein
MYEKNHFPSFSGLGQYYGQTESPLKEMQSVLPPSVAVDSLEVEQEVKNPMDYISKNKVDLGWRGARKFLRRPIGSAPKTAPVAKAQGGVYWTGGGPKFSQKPVKGGAQAETVQAPEKVFRPSVSVVRDKPRINLAPIEMPTEASFQGLGELSPLKIGVPVLCLLIVGFLLYRRQ